MCHFLNVASTACNGRNSLFHVVTGFTGEYVMSGLCKEQASSLFSQELVCMCGEIVTSCLLGFLRFEVAATL